MGNIMVKTTLNTLFIILFSFQLTQAMVGVPAPAAPAPVVPVAAAAPLTPLDQELFDGVDKNSIYLVNNRLARGANVNAIDQFSRTPLHYAAQNGSSRIVLALLRNGANPNAQDSTGITPLMFASMNDHTRTVNYLLKNFAHPDFQDHFGRTALICAASQGYMYTTLTLVQHRADKTLTANGLTARDYALAKGDNTCAYITQ